MELDLDDMGGNEIDGVTMRCAEMVHSVRQCEVCKRAYTAPTAFLDRIIEHYQLRRYTLYGTRLEAEIAMERYICSQFCWERHVAYFAALNSDPAFLRDETPITNVPFCRCAVCRRFVLDVGLFRTYLRPAWERLIVRYKNVRIGQRRSDEEQEEREPCRIYVWVGMGTDQDMFRERMWFG